MRGRERESGRERERGEEREGKRERGRDYSSRLYNWHIIVIKQLIKIIEYRVLAD